MGSLFSSPPKPKPPPPPPPPTEMPDPGDAQKKARKRRSAAIQGRDRSGADSTLLSEGLG
jgi:hypothetical protein